MHNSGRPIKYTPERLNHILDNIEAGVPYRLAAKFAGITESTLYDWLDQGNKYQLANIDHPLASFSESVKQKENAKLRKVLSTLEAADKNWQASAWLLERRWWQEYSSHAPLIELNKRLDAMEGNNERTEEMDTERP